MRSNRENPFTPSFGIMPPYLAGRESAQDKTHRPVVFQEICMLAAKTPLLVAGWRAAAVATILANSGSASVGGMALEKLGRRPLPVLARAA